MLSLSLKGLFVSDGVGFGFGSFSGRREAGGRCVSLATALVRFAHCEAEFMRICIEYS